MTCIPGTMIPKVPKFVDLLNPDKLVHLFLFTVLVFLILRDFQKPSPKPRSIRYSLFFALNIGIFLGALTELLQATPFVIGRQSSIYDFIANAAGCFLGWGIFVLWTRRKTKSEV